MLHFFHWEGARHPLVNRLGKPQTLSGRFKKMVSLGPVGNQSPNGLIIWYVGRENVNMMLYCSGFMFYCFGNKNSVGDLSGLDQVLTPTLSP
jgi:hypothetical protein